MQDDFLNYCEAKGDAANRNRTHFMEVFPKTIINKAESRDVDMDFINEFTSRLCAQLYLLLCRKPA